MGQQPVWYTDHDIRRPAAHKWLKNALKLDRKPTISIGVRRKPDAGERQRIELVAMTTARSFFQDRGYRVSDVSKQALGWDIEARQSSSPPLLVEVKGLSDSFGNIELTPNEFGAMNRKKSRFVLFVASDIRRSSESPHLSIFRWRDSFWTEIRTKRHLVIRRRVGANCSL